MSGVYSRAMANTEDEAARYAAKSTGTTTACGQSRSAVRKGIAERTPYSRTS